RRGEGLRARRVEAVNLGGGTANLTPPADLRRLLGVLARLSIDGRAYEAWFGDSPLEDFAAHWQVLEDAQLVRRADRARIELTSDGMFYADAIAGLLAHRRIGPLQPYRADRAARQSHMGEARRPLSCTWCT